MRVALVLLALLAAGCVDVLQPGAVVEPPAGVRVVDEAGAPVPYAAVTFLRGGAAVGWATSGLDGVAPVAATADEVLVAATGYAAARVPLGRDVVLAPAAAVDASDASPVLRMLPPHDFGTTSLLPVGPCLPVNSCGLSEPVLEVAGDGAVYASGTCCVGKSPPVWASRDGGATWAELATPGVREATGIEGDLAVDDAGNLYFTDILLGALWLTSWDAEGNWRHTVPVPLPPLVDRPWVRAGAEDVVYFLYNMGGRTGFHVSHDGGQTFPPVGHVFPAGLGALAQGPERDDLWVLAGGKLYASTDGGATWSEGEDVPRPDDAAEGEDEWVFPALVVDEAGRVLVATDLGSDKAGYRVYASVREPDGTWRATRVSPPDATHVMPWPAAGRDGGFVLAWYGTDDAKATPNGVTPDAEWFVFLAASHDAGRSWQTVRADPAPVLKGPMDRRLLDFLQVDVGPDGAAHVAYAADPDATSAERTLYARTTVGLGLAPLAYPNGPKAGHAHGGLALRLG